ncbi:MAG TPA: AAA family ATPase, partial [Ktedonobacterales bacterium]|nr:AAA family ATPase [Ktedonobacterales bacterium]
MPKATSKYTCQQCGYESVKWMGRCPDCGEWNSLVETVSPALRNERRGGLRQSGVAPVPLTEVEAVDAQRMATGSSEFDRVLGGGIVPGTLMLVGGDPGIGKSTLMLQAAGYLALRQAPVLYVSAEESNQQIRLRADRLGIATPRMLLLAETDIDAIAETAEQVHPSLVIVDSIQTVASAQLP